MPIFSFKRKTLTDYWKTLRLSAWLGWQQESNWADPLLFFGYSILRPLSGALILVFMYMVITGGKTQTEYFGYLYIGNAFYIYVGQVLFGISWVIIEDREFFRILKIVYLSPISIYTYLVGRGMAKMAVATMAVVFTLAFGILFLDIPVDFSTVNYPLLFGSLVFGLISICFLGIILAGITLLIARHSMAISEAVSGLFFFLCGAIFPLTILPSWISVFGKGIPITYWLEATRRALLPDITVSSLPDMPTNIVVIVLIVSCVGLIFASHLIFRMADRIARRKGLIDKPTQY